MGRRLGDPGALTRLLALSSLVRWRPQDVGRRRADAAETIALAAATGDPEAALWAHMIRYVDALSLGEIAAADAELEAYAALAEPLRQPYYRWYLTVLRAGRAVFAGRLEEGERLSIEAVELNREHEPDAEQEHAVQRLALALARGRPADADAALIHRFADRYAGLPLWRALAVHLDSARGDGAAARDGLGLLLADGLDAAAADRDAVTTLSLLAEPCAGLGDRALAEGLRARLLPYTARAIVVERGWALLGAVARPLGLLASALGDGDAAAAHLEHALALHRRWGARPLVLRSIGDLARHVPERAPSALLDEGEALAAELDAPGLAPLRRP
jgi:hypothetical protein